ncbi:MAG TPA: hypothetical protein VF844_11805 [Ktedonobacteraceae bacterium]
MANLKKLPLGQDGIKFVESRLVSGGKGICLKLLNLPLSEGTVYAVVPEDTSLDRAKQFETGGLAQWIYGDAWLAKHVISLYSDNMDGTLIFHDVWGASPTDSGFRKKRKSEMFFNQTDVYHFVEAGYINSDIVIRTMREIASFLLIGAFINFPIVASELPADGFVDDSLIDELVRNTQEIYVSAYDQEGFVVWQR